MVGYFSPYTIHNVLMVKIPPLTCCTWRIGGGKLGINQKLILPLPPHLVILAENNILLIMYTFRGWDI
jgi:hypothetical protein